MSSKRKSPPSKLPEGSEPSEVVNLRAQSDTKENDSSLEDRISRGPSPNSKRTEDTTSSSYKMSPTSDTSSASALASGSEYEDFFSNDEEGGSTPPRKRPRIYAPQADIKNCENGFLYPPYEASLPFIPPFTGLMASQNNFLDLNYERMLTNSANAMDLYGHKSKKSSSMEFPPEKGFNVHLNNNSTLHNHNEHGASCGTNGRNENTNSSKKSMDNVLKMLNSKINDNSIKEERRSHSPSSKRR